MNLLQAIRGAAHDRDTTVTFLRQGSPEVVLPVAELLRTSAWLSRKLPEDTTVVIVATDPLPTLLAFFGALWAGSRPLILPSPHTYGGATAYQQHITRILARFPGGATLAVQDGLDLGLSGVNSVPLAAGLDGYGAVTADPVLSGPVAFLQATSASTGDATILAVSHANACANFTALHTALAAGDDERMVSWLPLYHDMGLVGTVLLSLFHGWPLYLMTPTEFIMRPQGWLRAISRYRGTITAAPNFGYDLAARAAGDLGDCDLSTLRAAVIGAEPIRLATLEAFHRRFAPYGLHRESLVCAYGMAECTLATTMHPPGAVPRYVLVDPVGMEIGTPVRLRGEGLLGDPPPDGDGVAVFSLGGALDGLTVGLVDDAGAAIDADAVLGEITVRGSSVVVDGLLQTGDLGFRHRGEVFVLERRKQVIIRHGRNHLASLLEERVAAILDHPAHEVLVLETDIHDPAATIAAVVERCRGPLGLTTEQVRALRELDLPVDLVLFARRWAIPRTTSGKKRYHTARQRLADGVLPLDHAEPTS